jgi:hypothetical protein
MYKTQDFGIFILSNRPEMARAVISSVLPYEATIFNGDGYESFSKLFNTCIQKSPYELNIIIGDKALAKKETIDHIISNIKNGYFLVAACGFACVGFYKDLFRIIGPLDERFTGGSFEDSDFLTRLKHNNLGFYYSWECEHIKIPSSWGNFDENKQKYILKWGTEHISQTQRKLADEYSDYNFGILKGSYVNKLDFYHTKCTFEV